MIDAPRVEVRVATPADARVLAALAARLFEQSFGEANTPENMAAYLEKSFGETRQKAELEAAESRFWLAESERGEAVGYAHVRLGRTIPVAVASDETSKRQAELVRLYVDRALHGSGLGAALIERCVATAASWGADRLWLGVWERNARAIAFYEKHGFRQVGDLEFLLGADRQTDRVMVRSLSGWRVAGSG